MVRMVFDFSYVQSDSFKNDLHENLGNGNFEIHTLQILMESVQSAFLHLGNN